MKQTRRRVHRGFISYSWKLKLQRTKVEAPVFPIDAIRHADSFKCFNPRGALRGKKAPSSGLRQQKILNPANFDARWLTQPNASEISIIVILAAEAKFSTTANLRKVFTNKCNIDGQTEIAISWPPKPELLVALKLLQTVIEFQRQIPENKSMI